MGDTNTTWPVGVQGSAALPVYEVNASTPPLAAGEAVIGKTQSVLKQREVVLSLHTSQYASGDVLAATQEISDFFRVAGGSAFLYGVDLLDKDKQSGALDILFLRSSLNIGAENGAYSISDTQAEEIVGEVDVVASDYKAWTEFSKAYLRNVGSTAFKCDVIQAPVGVTSLWIAVISRDTKTYSAAGLRLLLTYSQES